MISGGRPARSQSRARSCVLLGLVLTLGCAGADTLTGGLDPAPTGRLAVTIGGMDDSLAAAVLVTGPSGFRRALTRTDTLSALTPGAYLVEATEVSGAGHRWSPISPSQTVAITGDGPQASVEVRYQVSTGALQIDVVGLPEGTPAALSLTGPAGYSRSITGATVLTGLAPGSYVIDGLSIQVGTAVFAATLPVEAVVQPGRTPAPLRVEFLRLTGRLAIGVNGLPAGLAGTVTLTGPGGFSAAIAATDTVPGLDPGSYTLAAGPVLHLGNTWQPSPASQTVEVVAGATAAAAVRYGISTGGLTVMVLGVPEGASAAVTIAGPGGFSRTVTATTALTGLEPGTYFVTAPELQVGGQSWRPTPASQSVSVAASTTPSAATVSYALATGGLALAVTGLPGGVPAAVTVTGPGGYSRAIAASETMVGLVPGSYVVAAAQVAQSGQTWVPTPASQSVTVTASLTPASASVRYSLGVGSLSVTISGLPGGSAAAVTVTGPQGFSQSLTSSRTLTGLAPGSYAIAAGPVNIAGQTWSPSPPSQSASVTIGGSTAATVQYAQSTGSLSATITGLPNGTAAAVTVSGPGGYSQGLTGSGTLTGLAPGSYTVAASSVTGGGSTWAPSPPSQVTSVAAGATAAATVTYSAVPATTLNLRIDGAYLTQATQRYDGTVPLVAGRDAYLRVFALANEANTSQPPVRVRLYSGTSLVQTWSLPAPAASVPQSVNEGSLTASWNVLVPGSLVQPNLRVLADVDPANAVPEADESDNSFPSSGTPGAVDVRALPTFNLRFVPVLQQVNGLQGAVSDANKEQFLADLKRMLPVGAYAADVRLPYTTTAPVLQSDNANGAWGTILSELLALRSADGSTQYYYGVVRTSYSSGVAGMGYVGGGARTAIGWDRLPSGSGVMAHEVGHNMGRRHAPCGGAGSPDPSFPYSGGGIGVWGLDVAALALKSPATFRDLMGYCSPDWISDYNWEGMVGYRQGGPNNAPAATGSGSGLLVWGRITPSGPVLEPAFVVEAPPSLPAPGPDRIDLLDRSGAIIRSVPFAATDVADLPGGPEAAFAFVLPLGSADIGEVRLRAGGRSVAHRRQRDGADPGTAAVREGSGVVLRWNAAQYPMVLVRDASTGQVLSFARGGEVRLPGVRPLRLTYSDGVTSREERPPLR